MLSGSVEAYIKCLCYIYLQPWRPSSSSDLDHLYKLSSYFLRILAIDFREDLCGRRQRQRRTPEHGYTIIILWVHTEYVQCVQIKTKHL